MTREQAPASTLVVVKQLFRPELLVEVKAIAVTKDRAFGAESCGKETGGKALAVGFET